MQITDRLKTT